ncbi:hypothetical protein BWK69_00650, partial [Candidatus Parcubacteria bacterium A4]
MLVDSHSHVNFKDFDEDRDEVVRRALAGSVSSPQVTWMINVGTDYESSKKAIEIAEKYQEGVYASVGVHPSEINSKFEIISQRLTSLGLENLKKLAESEKVVAIGEIGLDYKYLSKNKDHAKEEIIQQKELFSEQIRLAQELNLPMIIHCRDAFFDILEILEKQSRQRRPGLRCLRGVVHCFTGDIRQAEKFIGLGFHIGFTGIIFRESEKENLEGVIRNIP